MAIDVWGSGEIEVAGSTGEPFEHRLLQLNIDKAKLELGWQPHWDSDQAIFETVGWYKRVLSGEAPTDVSLSQVSKFMEITA